MIRQDCPELKIYSELPFQAYACKLFCLYYYAEQLLNEYFDPESIVDTTEQLMKYGYIDDELAVYGTKNTKMVLRYLSVPVRRVRVEPAEYKCKKNEYEILKLVKPGYMHFVPGDGEGHYTWDPLGIRKVQRDYTLDSKRIIEL